MRVIRSVMLQWSNIWHKSPCCHYYSSLQVCLVYRLFKALYNTNFPEGTCPKRLIKFLFYLTCHIHTRLTSPVAETTEACKERYQFTQALTYAMPSGGVCHLPPSPVLVCNQTASSQISGQPLVLSIISRKIPVILFLILVTKWRHSDKQWEWH